MAQLGRSDGNIRTEARDNFVLVGCLVECVSRLFGRDEDERIWSSSRDETALGGD